MKDQYDFSKGKRGAIDHIPKGKTQITLCLDDEIIDWFRESVNAQNGGNYQTLINEVLREYIKHKDESLEALLRRVLREELTPKN
ncbi:BrnA antitoxin family protein [Crocosphaera sp. XPORK-15E]|uniref:BrnA antitoxin family protein n=1 Tax=Crocosphaera sp. XPORK-15E TaxID=3110247 RepID=UPI002B1EE343|nr:BrnA antitoxin family protein [Crocosphaera sp. XPORK-15E]MEA5534328.1 BrnA antitoxin family protein [Crocosphaera sp. XPORK-15E]